MPSGINEALNIKQNALRLREERQGVLASNIANADTPNYKARDINFSAALRQATHASHGKQSLEAPLPLATTSGAHLSGKSTHATNSAIQYRNDQEGRVDGNNVDTDQERMEIAKNAMGYDTAVALVTAQIRNMLAAAQN